MSPGSVTMRRVMARTILRAVAATSGVSLVRFALPGFGVRVALTVLTGVPGVGGEHLALLEDG